MDHRQLEVRVGVVDRLPTGLGNHDERERHGRERERRGRPGLAARRAGDDAREVRSCPRRAPRRRGRGRASPRRRPTTSDRGSRPGGRTRSTCPRLRRRRRGARGRAARQARAHRGRRPAPGAPSAAGTSRIAAPIDAATSTGASAIDERRPLDVDAALAPETAELAVRLERPGATSALEPGLGLLREADQERSDRNATDRPGRRRRRATAALIRSPRSGRRAGARRRGRSGTATYVPRRPL